MIEADNQYPVDHVSYPDTADEKNISLLSAYGALIKGVAVCQTLPADLFAALMYFRSESFS